jgi:hypothetical protein
MKKRLLFTSIIAITLVLMALFSFNQGHFIVFAVDNTAFRNVYVVQYQYNDSNWDGIANFTAVGESARIVANQPINFTIQVTLNNTYASSSSDALTFTWIGMNVSTGGLISSGGTAVTGWNNQTLNNATSAVSYGANSDWLVTKCGNWTSTLPAGGTTYTIQITYEAEY